MTVVKDISQDLHLIQTCEASHWLLQLKAPCHYYPKSRLVKKHILDPISTLISYTLNMKKIQSLSSCHYGSSYWQLKCTEEKSVHLLIENATEVNNFYEPWDILNFICNEFLYLFLASALVALHYITGNLGIRAFVISGAWLLQFLHL